MRGEINMYKEFFGFEKIPFTKEIDDKYLFNSENFITFKSKVDFLKKHRGVGVFYGPPGTGKSVGLRWLYKSLSKNKFKFYYSPKPPETIAQFYREIALSLELKPKTKRPDLFRQIQDHINELFTEKRIVPVIALDECQLLSHEILESVIHFLNFDIDSRDKVILILAGQQSLRKRLKLAVYEPLVQRVTSHYKFEGLKSADIDKYLMHRLKIAGVKHQLFEDDAIMFIYQLTKGVMRKINTLALKSIDKAALLKRKTIGKDIIESMEEDIFWL
jgi:type II secretory pathway predicted ATPase ExeA